MEIYFLAVFSFFIFFLFFLFFLSPKTFPKQVREARRFPDLEWEELRCVNPMDKSGYL